MVLFLLSPFNLFDYNRECVHLIERKKERAIESRRQESALSIRSVPSRQSGAHFRGLMGDGH